MFKAVVGQGECVDTVRAVRDAIEGCERRLGGRRPSAGIVLAASGFDHPRMLAEIRDAFPGMDLIGCTTSGEMSSGFGFSEDSVCLMLFVSDRVSVSAGLGRAVSEDPGAAVAEAVNMARRGPTQAPALCIALPDSFLARPGALIAALSAELGTGCPVLGGFAGGEELVREKVHQFFGSRVLTDAVPVLLFSGPLRVSFSVSQSWSPMGPRVSVDRVRGNEVLRIGGRTALDFYRHTLGPHTIPATEMPLAVFEDSDHFYIRSPISYNGAEGSILFTDVLPEGASVQITEASAKGIVADVASSLGELRREIGAWRPAAGLAFSCAARKWILGPRTREELASLTAALPADLDLMGFYGFGEISPLKPGFPPRLHNCTMVTLLMGEAGEREAPSEASVSPESPPARASRTPESALLRKDLEIRLLEKKLQRAELLQERLEYQKEIGAGMLQRINQDLREANRTIRSKNRLLRKSLALAEEVQQRLLPRSNPRLRYFDIAGRSIYCDETGGDYFDFLADPENRPDRFSVVVGDVSGHGIAAALLMTTARALVRMRASKSGDMAECVTDINRLLTEDIADSGSFMTLFYLSLEPETRRLFWVRAGHDPAMVYDPESDAFHELRGEGMAMGVSGEVGYRVHIREGMKGGQIILLGTDGIWETRNPEDAMFGKQRLRAVVRKHAGLGARDILDRVVAKLDEFRRGRDREDDVTLVVVKIEDAL